MLLVLRSRRTDRLHHRLQTSCNKVKVGVVGVPHSYPIAEGNRHQSLKLPHCETSGFTTKCLVHLCNLWPRMFLAFCNLQQRALVIIHRHRGSFCFCSPSKLYEGLAGDTTSHRVVIELTSNQKELINVLEICEQLPVLLLSSSPSFICRQKDSCSLRVRSSLPVACRSS